VPVVVQSLSDRRNARFCIYAGLAITSFFYAVISIPTALYFGRAVKDSCNLDWQVGGGFIARDAS
jgi:hypothetical protein